MVNYYLEKNVIIKQKSKQLSNIPNYVKLIIHVIDRKNRLFLPHTTEISSIVNTIKKLQSSVPFVFFCQQKLYHDKQDIMDEMFYQYHLPLLKYIDRPELITERKQNIDYDAYEKI